MMRAPRMGTDCGVCAGRCRVQQRPLGGWRIAGEATAGRGQLRGDGAAVGAAGVAEQLRQPPGHSKPEN